MTQKDKKFIEGLIIFFLIAIGAMMAGCSSAKVGCKTNIVKSKNFVL
jgi:hypothetical protein